MTTYTVQARDNLTKIAAAHDTTVEKLAKLNNISDPNKIFVGQKLIFEEVKQDEAKTEPPVAEDFIGFDTFQRSSRTEENQASSYAPLAYAAGGAALYETGKKAMPKLRSGMETLQLRGMYAQDAAKRVANNVAQKAKHAAKSAELHYAFGKDAVEKSTKQAVQKGKETATAVKTFVSNKAEQLQKTTAKKSKAVKKSVNKKVKYVKQSNSRATRLLDGKKVRIKGNSIKLGKAGKILGKAATPLTILYSVKEVTQAYDKGGTEAAVKRGTQCAAGIAGGWAGAKAGAAIGTMICPGIGTAIGGFVGGIAGYMIGEKLCS